MGKSRRPWDGKGSAKGGSLTLVSATRARGHCKGKRGLFIGEGKRDVWACVAIGGSLLLAPAAAEKWFETFSGTSGGQ